MSRPKSPTNMLTFDIEEWFHANYDNQVFADYKAGTHFRSNMETLLRICRETGSKGTFFVLGSIGENYPDVVKAIVAEGHEVASHGYGHQLAYKQTYDEFKNDVKKSIDILENLTGKRVLGYRAPSWSIVESNLHYLEALVELDLTYDASIFPVQTFLYGIPTAPTEIHKPQVNGKEINLYEVPMSVMNLAGRNIGYSGGFYFRFFPKFLIQHAIRSANRQGKSSIVYLHPREINENEQRLNLPFKENFIHYYNVRGTKTKLEAILGEFNFTSIAEHLKHKIKADI